MLICSFNKFFLLFYVHPHPIVAMDPLQLILARYFNIWNFACAIRDEETAVAAAKAWLLIPARTPRCPICRGNMSREPKLSYKLKYRLRCWRCAREGRPSIRSPLKNTFFERSHVSVLDTLRLMLHFLRKDKVSQAAVDVGVTKKKPQSKPITTLERCVRWQKPTIGNCSVGTRTSLR